MTSIPPPSFPDLMQRWHGEMSRLLDAAECACKVPEDQRPGGTFGEFPLCQTCDFLERGGFSQKRRWCKLKDLRRILGPATPSIKLCPREQAGLCTGDEPCPHDCRKPGWGCGLEDAALEAAEGFQREEFNQREGQ